MLANADDDLDGETSETPIWLNLTTKKHIVDEKRLKPGKIALPHPLNTSSATTICLITADPQRAYKDIVASPAFPTALAARITRIIGVTKIKTKYHQYEAQRQLLAEHDIFLADDRIITQLPKLLGKSFYKSSAKRPVPVSMQPPTPRSNGKKIPKAKDVGTVKKTVEPMKLAAEINKTISSALVSLSPSTQTSVRIGLAGWSAEDIADNIEAATHEIINKFVPQKWRGVRAIHIKGPNSAALPIWLADELWTDDGDVLEDAPDRVLSITSAEIPNVGKKRKAVDAALSEPKSEKKVKVARLPESNDTSLDREIALRKEKLKKQKLEAAASVEDDMPKFTKSKATKKTKKSKLCL